MRVLVFDKDGSGTFDQALIEEFDFEFSTATTTTTAQIDGRYSNLRR